MKWMDEDRFIWVVLALVALFFTAQMVRAFIKFVWFE
jgi:hypothetical protein